MNILALGQLAAKLGMNLAGNARVAIELHLGRVGGGQVFDVAADTMTPDPAGAVISTDARDGSPLLGLPYEEKEEQLPKLQISEGDFTQYSHTLAVEAAALPAGRTVTENDRVVEGGKSFEILAVEIDPARALWLIHLRR